MCVVMKSTRHPVQLAKNSSHLHKCHKAHVACTSMMYNNIYGYIVTAKQPGSFLKRQRWQVAKQLLLVAASASVMVVMIDPT